MKRFIRGLFLMTLLLSQGYSQINWKKRPDNPVFLRGANGTWDDTFVSGPTISHNGTYYHMWYSGYDGEENGQDVGYARSEDGIEWNRNTGSVLQPGTPGNWDGISVFQPGVIMGDGLNQMWYCGHNSSDLHDRQIGYATSKDSINWTKHPGNPVLGPGTEGSWDDVWVGSPDVIVVDGTYHMYYEGSDGEYTQVGHATSADGIGWKKDPLNPVLTVGEGGSWDDLTVGGPCVVYDGQVFHMWYSGGEESAFDWKAGYAYSTDGSNWIKVTVNRPVLALGDDRSWESTFAAAGGVEVMFNDDLSQLMMWYGGGTGFGIGDIGFASSFDLVSGVVRDTDVKNITQNFSLYQNYPNPFNPSTTIEFTLPKSEFVELKVYNILGKEVSILISQNLNQGSHSYKFDGREIASGVYYYRLEAGNFVQTRKMIYLK